MRDVQVREDVCEFCGRKAFLTSYETTQCGVFVFLPIYFMGRKRILDQCSECRWHKVLSLEDWNRVRDETVRDVNRSFDEESTTPRGAVEGLLKTAYFHIPSAAELAERISRRFPDDDDLQLALGKWYRLQNMNSQADGALGRDKNVRKKVKSLERKLGPARPSILPKRFNYGLLAFCVFVLLVGLAVWLIITSSP